MANIITIIPCCNSIFFRLIISIYLRKDKHHHCPSVATTWEEIENQSHRSFWKAAQGRPFSSKRRGLEDVLPVPEHTADFQWKEGHESVSSGHFPLNAVHTVSLQMYAQSGSSSLGPPKQIFTSVPLADLFKARLHWYTARSWQPVFKLLNPPSFTRIISDQPSTSLTFASNSYIKLQNLLHSNLCKIFN